jgi:hypothetical protein
MADKRIHGVVDSTSPLTIRAQRQSYVADEQVDGLTRGAIVTFVAAGNDAKRVKAAKASKSAFVEGRHHGIISCAQSSQGEHFTWVSTSTLATYAREIGDDLDDVAVTFNDRLQLGDYVAFNVMDGMVWEPAPRGRR